MRKNIGFFFAAFALAISLPSYAETLGGATVQSSEGGVSRAIPSGIPNLSGSYVGKASFVVYDKSSVLKPYKATKKVSMSLTQSGSGITGKMVVDTGLDLPPFDGSEGAILSFSYSNGTSGNGHVSMFTDDGTLAASVITLHANANVKSLTGTATFMVKEYFVEAKISVKRD